MTWTYKKILQHFNKSSKRDLLKDSRHGLERECLRTDQKGRISQTLHPKALGSALKNTHITTDFAEAQLELVTPPMNTAKAALSYMQNIYSFVDQNLTDSELLWPKNMPCILPSEGKIKIGQYGSSNAGKMKTLYRLGLSKRYGGAKMQTVSGTHYNFSFGEDFWKDMHKNFAPKTQSLQDFKTESYLKLIRNFLRYSWLNTYLFGASPALDKSYLQGKTWGLTRHGWSTYYGKYATSLRLSKVGYYSKVQAQLAISFNDINSYIEDLEYAVSTPARKYKGLPGLNENILQIENEHYSRIRPKQIPQNDERPLEALRNRGIAYVEARAVDIDPFCPIGLCERQIHFLHIFLVYCLFKDSPKITKEQEKIITENQSLVAMYGRKPGLKLQNQSKSISLKDWASEIMSELHQIADLLDKNYQDQRYSKNLKLQEDKISNPELTPSAKLIKEMLTNKESFIELGLRYAKEHKKHFKAHKLSQSTLEKFQEQAKKSLEEQEFQEIKDQVCLEGYEEMEVSTQLLIRAAKKRKIKVEVLDKTDNFIRLRKGKNIQYVKQATLTENDSLMSYMLMKNKIMSKIVLAENGIKVPQGSSFDDLASALSHQPDFQKFVVKPLSTNFGIGISILSNLKDYPKALEEAFSHDKSVIVEEFIEGKEYRFLVIEEKVVAVLHRVPANVVGDGKSSITELVAAKNADPYMYKFTAKSAITLGKTELAKLKSQKLNPNSIPKKGEQIFLRNNSNISTGGDPIDFTNQVHKSYKKIAIKAAQAAAANICGVDMIVTDPQKPANKSDYSVIEINYNPTIKIHHFPVQGQGRDCANPVLDFLGF